MAIICTKTKRLRGRRRRGGVEDGGGLAGISWLWSLLAQWNDEQHGPISICLLPVCLQPTGASTICHCRMLDRPHASKHFNTAQPTSNHLRGCDCRQEVDPDRCSPHVRHGMNQNTLWCLFTQRYVPYDVFDCSVVFHPI